MSSIVIKSTGREERFDVSKLQASLRSTIIASGGSKEEADKVSETVTHIFLDWLGHKKHVSSKEIRAKVSSVLKEYNHIAAYLYDKHRVLS